MPADDSEETLSAHHHHVGDMTDSLQSTAPDHLAVMWRSGLKRVWGLPTSCRSTILCIISDTLPLLDLIHKRSVMYVKCCLQSESVLVKSVANYGVFNGRMISELGRNVQTCCEHFSLSKSLLLGMPPSCLSGVLSRHSVTSSYPL